MRLYSVEATVAATDDLDSLRRFTDIVPGTVLIEDPAAPTLVFPVEARSVREAVSFVTGVAHVGGLELVSGAVDLLDDDFHPEGNDDESTARGVAWRSDVTERAARHGLVDA